MKRRYILIADDNDVNRFIWSATRHENHHIIVHAFETAESEPIARKLQVGDRVRYPKTESYAPVEAVGSDWFVYRIDTNAYFAHKNLPWTHADGTPIEWDAS